MRDKGLSQDALNQQLRSAARARDAASVRSTLERGAHPDGGQASPEGTPLSIAAGAGSLACVEALIAAGADLNLCASWPQSPLFAAAAHLDTAILATLIKHGADLHRLTRGKDSVVDWVVAHKNLPALNLLLAAAAPADSPHRSVVKAIRTGAHMCVPALLAAGASSNRADPSGLTPLLAVARFWPGEAAAREVLTALMAAGARPDNQALQDLFIYRVEGPRIVLALLAEIAAQREADDIRKGLPFEAKSKRPPRI